MRGIQSTLLTSIVIILTASPAVSLPRFALMTGLKCASCHVNPTGGQMRNEFGFAFGTEKLTLPMTRDDEFPVSPRLSDNISVGLDYRSQFIFDNAPRTATASSSTTTTFQSMTTSLYGTFRLSSRMSFFVKQDVVNGTYGNGPYGGTEVYALLRILPKGGYIKGGTFLPDYGWKLDDHTAYTRSGDLGFLPGSNLPAVQSGRHGLIFLPNYKDIGGEIGAFAGDLFVTAGLFNGTGNLAPIDPSGDKAYAAKIEYGTQFPQLNLRLGFSGYGFRSFKMGGIYAGIGALDSNLTILGELDWTHNYFSGTLLTENVKTMAAYLEADYRIFGGVWLVGVFDTFDPLQGIADDDISPSTNTLRRYTLGAEVFPLAFLEVRPQLRLLHEQPYDSDIQLLTQFHVWF